MQHEPLQDQDIEPMITLLEQWGFTIQPTSHDALTVRIAHGTYEFRPVALVRKSRDSLVILGEGLNGDDVILRFSESGDCDITESNHIAKR